MTVKDPQQEQRTKNKQKTTNKKERKEETHSVIHAAKK